jgi:hypothetical protein
MKFEFLIKKPISTPLLDWKERPRKINFQRANKPPLLRVRVQTGKAVSQARRREWQVSVHPCGFAIFLKVS